MNNPIYPIPEIDLKKWEEQKNQLIKQSIITQQALDEASKMGKNMNTEQYGQLMQAVGELKGKVDGVNQRLDVSNGRLSKHDQKIEALGKFQDNLAGKIAIIGIGASALGALAMWALSYFLR